MRCLSPSPGYSIQVFEGREQVVVDARGYANTIQLQKPVLADFDRLGLLDHEMEAALEFFSFSGLPEGVNPLTRIGVFDSEAYCQRFPKNERDEMLVQMDARLRELQLIFPSEFIIVEPPVKARPWPSYDEDTAEDVLKFQERLRIDPESIRLYELENKNRSEVVDAMGRLEFGDAYIPESESDQEEITVGA
jgi:hypothetical protein